MNNNHFLHISYDNNKSSDFNTIIIKYMCNVVKITFFICLDFGAERYVWLVKYSYALNIRLHNNKRCWFFDKSTYCFPNKISDLFFW
jgi:hypothetical protein